MIAHEHAHVQNRDILIASVAATIAGAVSMLAHFAQWGASFGGMGSAGRHDERGGKPLFERKPFELGLAADCKKP